MATVATRQESLFERRFELAARGTNVGTALPYFLAMWLGNLFAIVPPEATAGALMVVGLLMLAAVGAGVILYCLLNARRAGPILWVVSAAFVVYFALGTR